MKPPKKCAMCRKEMAMWGHAVCKACFPNLPIRKPVEDTLAMIDAICEEVKA